MLKQMIKILSLAISLGLLFSGCSHKEVVTIDKVKYICNKQSIYVQPRLKIYIAKEDLQNAEKYKKTTDLAYRNYEKQVIENNRFCDKFKGGGDGKE